jgi:hypothetical protein
MDLNHKFRSGKYEGMTVEDVMRIDIGYYEWVKENKPQMLKPNMNQMFQPKPKPDIKIERKEPPPDDEVVPKTSLVENTDFLNQGPHGKLTSNKIQPNE